MPYISKQARNELVERIPETPGELNYKFTISIQDYLDEFGITYQHINDVLGALEGAKLEFYRRVAAPYEDRKIKENGDVYPSRSI